MLVLPEDIINKVMLYNIHPCAELIKKKRNIYSAEDDSVFGNKLWAHWVLKFENEFGVVMINDESE